MTTYCNRNADILLQGFMKPLKPRRAAGPTKELPLRACDKCCDWHRGTCRAFQKRKAAYLAARSA